MKYREIVSAFVKKENKYCSNGTLTYRDGKLYSYNTAIAIHLPKGKVKVNVTHYSATTSKHQNEVIYQMGECNVVRKNGVLINSDKF